MARPHIGRSLRITWSRSRRTSGGFGRGCRQLIAALGGEALDRLPPLDLTRLSPSPTRDQLRILAETGWLQRDGQGNFAFAHDRLRDWAIAENLVTTIHDPGALAHRLVAVAGYGKEESARPVVQAGYALMDGIWLLAKGTGGTERLRALAASGELIDTSEPSAALWFLWHSGEKGKADAREIANAWLQDDRATIKLARSVTSTGWSQGGGFGPMGDRVARSFSRVHPESLANLLDAERLHARVVELRGAGNLAPADMAVLDRFIEGWEHDRREREED